jgi:multidrug efflux pump subunit AcrA (membrane-fusion protein)
LSAAEAPKRNENTVILDETGVKNLAIEISAAEESRFESTVLLLGEIDHTCESHAVLSSRVSGRIAEVFAHKGDFVRKGGVVARMESRQPGNPPPVIELIAPGDGLIIESATHLGAPVEPDQELMTILDLTHVWVIAKVPQHHGGLLKDGLTATVKIPAIGEADVENGTIDAIFELPNPGNRLRPGMRAEITLATASRDGVLSIPREALQGDHSNHFVFIKDYELENAFVKTPVVAGARNESRVEIVSGLFPGDEVVTRGAYPLAFAGKGSASLREALDAAHGHPHNEDGTEMTREQIAAAGGADPHGHDHGTHSNSNSPVLFLSIACGVLFVLLLASPFVFRTRSKA